MSGIVLKEKNSGAEKPYCKSSFNSYWKSKDHEGNQFQKSKQLKLKDTSSRNNLKISACELSKDSKLNFKNDFERG